MKDSGNAADWDDVIGQFDRPRIVVNLEQMKVIPTLVESVSVEALLDLRRWKLVFSCDPSFSISWTGEKLDATVCVLLSRVAGIVIGRRSALPLSEVTLEHAAVLLVRSLSPPSARFLIVDDSPWTIDEPVGGMLGRVGFCLGVHIHGDRLRVSFLQGANGEIVSWRERRVHACKSIGFSQ